MTKPRNQYREKNAPRLNAKGLATARAAAQKRADQFNATHPIGTKVRYHPVIGQPEFTEHETRSEAMVIESGQAVVWLKDKIGCVALEAVEVAKEESEKCGHAHVKSDGFFSHFCEDCGEEL